MECLEYEDANELFGELVNEIKIPDDAIGSEETIETKPSLAQINQSQEDGDTWVEVFVPVVSLQKHITKSNNVDITEDDAIREASREKVLEMYGTSKIEAIPLSNSGASVDQATEPDLPADSEPSSGRLFVPPQKRNKRVERNPNPAYRCPECLVGFTRADNLKRHLKILHEGCQTFTCPHCNKTFARKNTLQRHVTSQHTREKKYACEYCSKTFIYSFEVAVHVQNNHSESMGYPCSMCDMKFKWPRSLERHTLSVHEGFKFKCTECGTLLGSLDAYKKHGARFHPTMVFTNSVSVDSHGNPRKKSSHVCPYCHSSFNIKANLDRHIDKIHLSQSLGMDYIECEWCNNKFKSHDTYQRHAKKFHESQLPARNVVKEREPNFLSQDNDMTEISLTEFLSNIDHSEPIAFP